MMLKKKTLFVLMVLATVCLLGNDIYSFIQFGFDLNKHAFFVQAIAFAFFALCVYKMPDDKPEEIDEADLPANVTPIKRRLKDAESIDEVSIPDHAKMRANTPPGLG